MPSKMKVTVKGLVALVFAAYVLVQLVRPNTTLLRALSFQRSELDSTTLARVALQTPVHSRLPQATRAHPRSAKTIFGDPLAQQKLAWHGVARMSGLTRAHTEIVSEPDVSNTPPEYDGRTRVAFQGKPGAYSEVVNKHYGDKVVGVPCDNFDELVSLVASGKVERGLIPIENSLDGTIHANIDLLLGNSNIHIVGEVSIPIAHCLLAVKGAKLDNITRVMSHPAALAQAKKFLAKRQIKTEPVYGTAASAKMVAAEGQTDLAAIATKNAARRYGLHVLHECTVTDDERISYTRFLELSNRPAIVRPARKAKTSLVMALPNRPGSLVQILTIFSMRGLDMTKIESRPLQSLNEATRSMIMAEVANAALDQFPAIFLMDVSGSVADVEMRNAIAHLHEEPHFMRVLGSYETPE
eukprot:gnl/TRDRNA2_/TRDRNA2_40611_c0_seq1.p1 gnl/TRDRNA2_/TRDRNA2_40611_c0~~gnl/TRDRNA2_/TRDRNA2_40611_c0_seq1.p1  ORF type:complete len:412 (-),score=56.39 gnl/TRDRNA2_/TRDRNA2_40611_c0_seq1:22-1257(-)